MKLHLGCSKRNFGPDWIHIDGSDNKMGGDGRVTIFSDNDMYNEIIDILNIPRVALSIEKFKPLLIKHQYDMITAFMICFNSHKTPQIWLEGEWSYFFSDLLPNLNDGGAIYLSFNEEDDNEQSQNDLFNSFKKCTAIVNRNDISLNKI